MVISWIFNSLNLDLANSALYVETLLEIWINLQEWNMWWDELTACSPSIMCTCGGQKDLKEKEERIRLGQFLIGLNEIYSAVRGQIMLMQPLPIGTDLVHAMSIKTHDNSRELHSNTQRQIRQLTSSLFCSYCVGTTHTVDRCYYLNGFPVGHKLHGKDTHQDIVKTSIEQNPQFTSEELTQIKAFFRNGKNTAHANYTGISTPFCSSFSKQQTDLNHWIIDSGATNHIATLIINTSPLFSQVALPNGSYSKIIGIGSIQLSNHLHIKNIMCAPSFHVNLLSVSQLTSAMNCSIQFFPTFCILQDLASKKMIGLEKQLNGLYYFVSPVKSIPTSLPLTHHVDSARSITWHKRLGHPSKAPLKFLSNIIPSFVFDSQHSCETCPLAKQTRLPFPSSSIQTLHSFDLIHCNIWGPFRTATHTGAHYFLTIVDDYTCFTWIFLMKFKSET
ncbi:hypothetical protein ACOSQ4_017430 [Xanthoceras sorbifolium]